jgi:low temperature requirement protein LtrA
VRGVVVPERTEDFTADPVELFFDLAYVFAFSQLVGHLVAHPDWTGVGEAALLFTLLWLPWQQFTWSANAVSGNGRTIRLLFLAATVTSVPMAASVSTALGPGGPVFAGSVVVIFLIGAATMALGITQGVVVRSAMALWVVPTSVALVVLVAGSFADGRTRVVAWIVSVATVLLATVTAGRGEWLIRTGHFAERHGLIVIVALGEVIVAIGAPVVDGLEEGRGFPGRTVVVLVAAGVFASLIWWSYFDRFGPAVEHRGEELVGGVERGRYVRTVYTWAHALITAGIVLGAAAVEEIALHPKEALAAEFRLMLFGGLVLAVTGAAWAVWRAFRVVARERLVLVAVLAVLLAAAGSWDGVALLVVVDLVLASALAAEHLRIER